MTITANTHGLRRDRITAFGEYEARPLPVSDIVDALTKLGPAKGSVRKVSVPFNSATECCQPLGPSDTEYLRVVPRPGPLHPDRLHAHKRESSNHANRRRPKPGHDLDAELRQRPPVARMPLEVRREPLTVRSPVVGGLTAPAWLEVAGAPSAARDLPVPSLFR